MIKDTYKSDLPFWLFAIALVIGFTLPFLIQDGMFMDAMLYTSVAHNLSEGIGTFWMPQFSFHNLSGLNSFHEQPPLVFGIQAVFFKVFGSSLYTERIYTFTTLCITVWLIHAIWRAVWTDENIKKMAWLPILMWITVRVVSWSYANNMHENTMGVFILASALFILKAVRLPQFNKWYYVLAGVFVFLATLSKGVPGFFVVALPVLYWLTTRKISFKSALAATAIIIGVPVILYGILLLFKESRESLAMYFFKRLIDRIHDEPTTHNRFDILHLLLSDLKFHFGLVAIILFAGSIKKSKTRVVPSNISMALFFILCGVAGSLPLMLTLVQKSFYLVPAYPFYAIGLSVLMVPFVSAIISFIKERQVLYKVSLGLSSALLIAALVISFMQAGKINKQNKDVLHDVYIVGKIAPAFSIITIPHEMWNDWDLQCYLIRYYNISLDPDENRKYLLVDRSLSFTIPPNYTKLDVGLSKYDIYTEQ